MTDKIFNAARETFHAHNDILAIILRIIFYNAALFASMAISDRCLGDTYMGTICVFTLFSVCLELLWAIPCSGLRFFVYACCLIGIFFTGACLISEGFSCARAESHKSSK